MPAKRTTNKALAAIRAQEAKRKPARRGSRPSGGSGGGWETVEEFGDWRLPEFHPTRPCPQCNSTSTPDVGRDNSLGSYWTCGGGHRFAVGPEDARLASCIESVEVTTEKGAKRTGPCTAQLQSHGVFLVCPRHQRAVWPRREGVSPITLCPAGAAVAERLARFEVATGDRYALRPGEVPIDVDDEHAAAWLAEYGLNVTPPEDDAPVAATTDQPEPGAPVFAHAGVATATGTAHSPSVLDLFSAPLPPPAPEVRLFESAETPVVVKRKTIGALSPSSAVLLEKCPREFEQAKVLGRPQPPGRAATLGKFVHKVLELLTARPLVERTEASAKEIAGRLWRDVDRHVDAPVEYEEADKQDVVELRRDRLTLNREVADVAGWVRQFKGESWAALAYAVSIEEAYGGEVAYRELNLWDTTVNGVPFRGYADRVDRHDTTTRRGLVVTDYKSGAGRDVMYWQREFAGQVDPERLRKKGRQLAWYWGPIEQKTGEEVIGAVLAYIGAQAQVVLWIDDNDRANAEAQFRQLWRNLQRYETEAQRSGAPYPAEPSTLCGWCSFFEDCPEGSRHLLDTWEKIEQRERYGKPTPAKVQVDSWTRERRQAWRDMARSA